MSQLLGPDPHYSYIFSFYSFILGGGRGGKLGDRFFQQEQEFIIFFNACWNLSANLFIARCMKFLAAFDGIPCFPSSISAVKVYDSQAYRNMEMTRERISNRYVRVINIFVTYLCVCLCWGGGGRKKMARLERGGVKVW